MSQRRPRRTAADAATTSRTPGRRHTAAHLSKLPPTITVDEAGDMLGISRRSAYRAAARGEIPTLRLGRRLLVPTPRLLALLGVPLDAPQVTQQAEAPASDTPRLVTASAGGDDAGRARPLPPPMRPRVPR